MRAGPNWRWTSSPSLTDSDLMRDEEVLISLTERGYIKRVPADAYRAQRRGGKGVTGMTTKDEDTVEHLYAAGSPGSYPVLHRSGQGLRRARLHDPRSVTRRQRHADQRLPGAPAGRIRHGDCQRRRRLKIAQGYFVLCTRKGRIKRVPVRAFASVRSNGLIAMSLDEDDYLRWVKHTYGPSRI